MVLIVLGVCLVAGLLSSGFGVHDIVSTGLTGWDVLRDAGAAVWDQVQTARQTR